MTRSVLIFAYGDLGQQCAMFVNGYKVSSLI
jgi:hypothetical protein